MDSTTSSRWKRIEGLLDAALDLPAEERAAFLREACGTDRELHEQVSQLVAEAEQPDPRLETSAADYAALLISRSFPVSTEIAEPELIDRYRIMREIGRGGMGTVYLAERSDFRQIVALKLVRRGLDLDESVVQRFRVERQILAALEHPNIARLLDGGVTADGLPYFVMEYVEGEPIDRFCDEHQLTIEQRLQLFCQAGDAVAHAHARGIVHRDLKPSNILVTRAGQVKLLDFGIAKLLAPVRGDGDLTRTGHRLMTPDYASPEQVRGEGVTTASDVYSLGVLLYELVTGRRPYQVTTPTPHELERAILEQEPTRPSTGGSTKLAGDVDAIILKAMRKVPARRYVSGSELVADIRSHLAGLPVTAQPDTWVYRSAKFVRRHRAAVAASVVFLVLLVVSTIATAAWVRNQTQREVTADAPVIAVGTIVDHRNTPADRSVRALSEMLATNLGRTSGIRIVSTARMYELLSATDDAESSPVLAQAARRAGATQLIEGSVQDLTGTRLRLDLRRVDLERGRAIQTVRVDGTSLFELADGATRLLVGQLGVAPPQGSVVDVTTQSETAYRLHDEGLRAYHRGDLSTAARLFEAALAEDSTFAMAAFNLARSLTRDRNAVFAQMNVAVRLADRASEREGLIIRAYRAWRVQDPALLAIADSLMTRYPEELEGPLYAGRALLNAAQYPAALAHLRQVVAMDSSAFRGSQARCVACEAQLDLVNTLLHMDSVAAAERELRNWTRLQPHSTTAWRPLLWVLSIQGDSVGSINAYRRAVALDPTLETVLDLFPLTDIVLGNFEAADRALRDRIARVSADERSEPYWYLMISLRAQGRLREALEIARASRVLPLTNEFYPMHEAQVLLELGRYRHAAALFDSVSHRRMPLDPESYVARHRTWALGHASNALAEAGDTARLRPLIDTLRVIGARSAFARDQRMHHHARGLLLAARGDHESAVAEFERAMFSPIGYTRTNYALARSLLALERPREAVLPLQRALRSGVEAGSLYVTQTELHELLAEAWDRANVPDSAVAHYRTVTRFWRNADPQFRPRVQRAEERIMQLERAR